MTSPAAQQEPEAGHALAAVESVPAMASEPVPFVASHHPETGPLAQPFVQAVQALEVAIARPVWLLVQRGRGPEHLTVLGPEVYQGFVRARRELKNNGPVALVVDSPGGFAQPAYQIARLLQRHAGGFTAVVPRYAKSAATLLCLGAESIIMGEDAELGPLDAQLWDPEREEPGSALDEVQALEQLHSVALQQLDQTMVLLHMRTPKKTDTLLPIACRFSSDLMAPLLDKVDAVHYARQARVLKVAEDYAARLLGTRMPEDNAKTIANTLVTGYPEHAFVIDRDEAASLGLRLVEPSDEIAAAVRELDTVLSAGPPQLALGRLVEQRGDSS